MSRDPTSFHLVVLILTLNEEAHIGDAIRSAESVADTIVVVDSGSQDRTCDIAAHHGAMVWHRQFDGQARQRNWALDRIEARWPGAWVLELDADERVSEPLVAEIHRLTRSAAQRDAYLVPIRFMFDGRLLRWGGFSRTWLPRLHRVNGGRYELRADNPQLLVADGMTVGRTKGHIDHSDVVSWQHHIAKHNIYSTNEAKAQLRAVDSPESRMAFRSALRIPNLRRRWVRERIWNHLPAKPLLLFIYSYLVCGGFLDGRAGFRAAVFRSWHAMCIELKYRERVTPPDKLRQRSYLPASDAVSRTPLVVCILTFNEEDMIARAIASARQVSDQVVVVDSYSTDATRDIAAAAGAEVWTNEFVSWGAQRNWALDRIESAFGNAWVFFLDADELITPRLARETVRKTSDAARPRDVFFLRRSLIFAGRQLRFGGFSRTRLARLFKARGMRHEERSVNDHLVIPPGARTGALRNKLIHDDVKSWDLYIARQNKYSTLEAQELVARTRGRKSVTFSQAVKNPPLRRRWLRETVWPHVPARPFVRFLHVYVVLGGFLDGSAGLYMATMQAWQEMCIELKTEELRRGRPLVLVRESERSFS
jgi:glycosyltransferase involved in cell wall biosynthesis